MAEILFAAEFYDEDFSHSVLKLRFIAENLPMIG